MVSQILTTNKSRGNGGHHGMAVPKQSIDLKSRACIEIDDNPKVH